MPDANVDVGSDAQSGSVKVLLKTMTVLNLLGDEPGTELALGDIAKRSNLNASTCHRILDTLSLGGYIEKPSPGRYRLGIQLFRVGARVAEHLDVRVRSLSMMTDLQRSTGETVFLYLNRGDEAVCVERMDGRYAATHLMKVGSALPLHVGASPKVFLGLKSDEAIEQYIERTELNDGRFPLDTAALWRDVKRIRETGTIASIGDIEKNTSAVGGPVRDHAGRVVAALSVSWVAALVPNDIEQMRELVANACTTISETLGYRTTTRDHGHAH